jgi:hypothetical protein
VPFGIPCNVIGLIVSGDLAGQTIYSDKFMRKVWFPQAPPKKPPSPMQVKQRARFATAMANWKSQTDAVKEAWEQITLRASLVMTGHNLWVHFSLSGDFVALETLQQQTRVTVANPPVVPWPDP